MAKDWMNYEALAQTALRGVVRMALERAATQGLPGEHHFYITFDSTAPGVVMSDWLKERYPEEMTIVLQHQYWGLKVRPESFDITLSFQKVGEPLTVPFEAVKAFFDPSVQFMLQFKPVAGGPAAVKRPGTVEQMQPAKPVEAATQIETAKPDAAPEPEKAKDAPSTGEVVSLDKFRKK